MTTPNAPDSYCILGATIKSGRMMGKPESAA
jgi:hypothetical protein